MDPNTFAKERGHLKPTDTVKLVEPTTTSTTTSMTEEDAVIEPQDQATIKYLSNVKDSNTGEISQPFTIADKNYQMIRGKASTGEIVMAVYCHDDVDENGENLIHSIEEFEQNIALPMKERLEMESIEEPMVSEPKHDTYEGRKHFLVKKGTNEVRSFSSIKEMLSSGKLDEEEYMGVSEFKKHMRVKSKSLGITGEIFEINNNDLSINYSDEKIAGWNNDVQYKTMILHKDDCVSLDNGLNSEWEIDLENFKKIIPNF